LSIATFIGKRIAFNQQKSFSRFIIRLSLIATTISVAVMVVTLALVNGFQDVVSQKVFSFWGHVRVQHYEPSKVTIAEELPIQKSASIEASIRSFQEVQDVYTFGTRYGILKKKNNENMEGVLLKGVDAEYGFNRLDQFKVSGRWISFSDSSYSKEINISQATAKQLEVGLGDTLILFFIQPGAANPKARPLKIVGIFKTGIEEYDKAYAIGDLRMIQQLNNWTADEIGGYEIFLNDYALMDTVSWNIFEALPTGWNSRTIQEIYPNIFDWLNIQNLNKYVVLVIMLVVAIINLVTCLIILVLERTRMIGLLKALGMRDRSIQRIFHYQGSIVSLGGIAMGLTLGLGLCFLQQKTGFIRLNEEAYYMTVAPIKIVWWQVGAIAAGTFLVCMLVLSLPILITRMIHPVKAIQFR
jgi:lipoprotein-releasing system permease protein